jgi:hypothetical protein
VTTPCPACGRTGGLRPAVVWFGEMPIGLDVIEEALLASDRFVAIGTSGSVYPAAGLVETARAAGIRTAELNLEPSDNAWAFDERRYGRAGEVVPAWVEGVPERVSCAIRHIRDQGHVAKVDVTRLLGQGVVATVRNSVKVGRLAIVWTRARALGAVVRDLDDCA